MSELPYSYHTFLFPFLWSDDGNTTIEKFLKVLSADKQPVDKRRWVETPWEKRKKRRGRTEDWLQDYAAFQYFTEAANAAIFNSGELDIVRCFEYRYRGYSVRNQGKYCIYKDSLSYRLDINNIRMHVYNSGVAILILEMENREYETLDDVNKINEYGRRINMPFFKRYEKGKKFSHPVCADRIEIWFKDSSTQNVYFLLKAQDYKKILEWLQDHFDEDSKEISFDYVMKPIQKLIDGDGRDNGGYKVTTRKEKSDSKNIFIKPCIDDRMFVCCEVLDNQLSNEIRGIGNEEDSFLKGWDQRKASGWADETLLSNRIYKFLTVKSSR